MASLRLEVSSSASSATGLCCLGVVVEEQHQEVPLPTEVVIKMYGLLDDVKEKENSLTAWIDRKHTILQELHEFRNYMIE